MYWAQTFGVKASQVRFPDATWQQIRQYCVVLPLECYEWSLACDGGRSRSYSVLVTSKWHHRVWTFISCPIPLTPSTRWVNPYEAPGDRTWRLYSVPSVEQANVPCSSALNVMLSPRVTAEVATWFQPKAQTDFILSVHWFWCWQDSEQRWVPFFQCFFGLLFQAFKFCLNPWK